MLRLSAPSDFGRNLLVPWLDEFQHLHSGLSLHLKMSDRAADLIRQPLDAVVRHGTLPDSSLLALTLASDNRRALRAAPAYVECHGAPATLDDLPRHNCLRYDWDQHIHHTYSFTLSHSDRPESFPAHPCYA